MTFLPPVNSAAIQILQQSKITSQNIEKNTPADNKIVATANGVKSDEVEATKDYWDINHVNPTQMKVKLFEAVGEAFGIDKDNYDTSAKYASAIQSAMDQIKENDPAKAYIIFHEIEKDLGLNELGISLEKAVEAMLEPGGKADEELDAALQAQADEINGDFGEDEVFGSLTVDSNGVYSLLR
ncbi:MAG: hypothetical protein JKY83_08495 [Rhizobiaceae bacterium]|nr:hypothetical protein [Rhizobiaceae bacterium]